MITIGEHKFSTHRPADLDAVLIEATGCDADEHRAMMERGGSAAQVARVLTVFLPADAPVAHELAGLIASDDLPAVRSVAVALLAPVAPAKAEKA